MMYSDRNRAWGRMLTAEDDRRREDEIARARAIRRDNPDLSWAEALKRATAPTWKAAT